MVDRKPNSQTDRLDGDKLLDTTFVEPEVVYQPVPNPKITIDDRQGKPVWRVRFDLAFNPSVRFGLDINDEIILGRGSDLPNIYDLSQYDAAQLGVSRHHLRIRPTDTALYIVDTGSTNGTLRNGQLVGVNTPYSLVNGDIITLGKLQLILRLVYRPTQTSSLEKKADLADALTRVAQAITSQLELDEVMNRVAEAAMMVTSAKEAGIWLIDQESGELFLEAQRGIDDERIRRMRLSIKEDSMPARVIKTGEPVRAARKPGGEQIKVKTDYLVEALLFIPLKLGGVTFGVLAATQREEGRRFSERDERLLGAIADFAAIAVQNARVYEAADRALSQRVVELAAINDLSMAVTQSLDLNEVYDILVDELSKHPLVHDVMLWLIKDNGQLDIYPDNEANQNKLKRTGDQYTKAVQEVVSSSAPSVSDFIDVDEEFTAVDGSSTSRIKARSLIALPLKAKKDVVGALALVAKRGSVRDDDLTRFQAFANPVATAIENARLYQQSEQSRAVITATASTLTQPLLILDDNGNVVIANKAAQELLDKHMSDLFNGLSAGVGRTTGIHLGEQIYLATSESTESVGTIVVMQDVTYEKQLEREQADIMRALSHDLKSPLTSIKGWAQLTQQVAKLEDKPEHYVNQIVYSADRMLSMINDLLNMAVNRDIPASALQPCSLDLPVRRAVSDVQGAALSKSITIDFSVTGTPFTIQGDENRLYHMALNLVENAIKYSPEKTEVAVELTFDKTSGITLAVSDQGPGIPEEDLLRIFERYIRGTNQTDIIGSGIGLSVVKAVAIAHGGSAEAMNLPGGGARFTVKIPATKTAV